MENRIKKLQEKLPEKYQPYIDKYFLRTGEILRAENLNPWVRAQVFIRKGPGKVYGIKEAVAILDKYTPLVRNGGKVYALPEGTDYAPKDTLMLIEAPIQGIVELETIYLGVLAAETTKANDKYGIDLNQVRENMAKVVKAAKDRGISYFGARHWRWDEDAAISKAAFEGGATSASTDIGAGTVGQSGVGTTPHVLENIKAWEYGYENAVVETIKSFDKIIDTKVPRIALIDYRNKEIDDTLAVAKALGERFYTVRIDTCGENIGQGAIENIDYNKLEKLVGRAIKIPKEDEKYWFGRGVSVTGTYALRKALIENGYNNIPFLSSGFADYKKVEAFVRAEELLGLQLFIGLGVGQIFESRASKMDIVAVGETQENFVPISKTGRYYNPNPKLELMLGGKIK